VCIDQSGQWMSAWKEKHLNIGTQYLRMPANHTPHKSPTALSSFCKLESRELLPTEGASLVPSLQLLEDFCHETIIKSAMAYLQGLIKDSVTAVHPHEYDEDEPGSVPVWPTWVQPDTFPAANAEQASTQLPDANGQQASAKVPLIQHATDVLVSQTDVSGRAVVIVGGGMTSAQLALRACSGGAASTTLICRHKLCVGALDCEVGWFGNKELAPYRANTDHLQRMRMCHTARGSASINATTMTDLHSAVSAGRLQLLEDCEVASSSQQGHRLDECIYADVLWLATGTAVDCLSDPLLSQLQAACPTEIVGGYPVLDDSTLAWPGLPLFLLGRSAMLSIGPAAGMLHPPSCQKNSIIMRTMSCQRMDFDGYIKVYKYKCLARMSRKISERLQIDGVQVRCRACG
ncbi:hypothetical protein COCSUDRAFT_16025, partial [Coccomyxa subellipsoidea C-169]